MGRDVIRIYKFSGLTKKNEKVSGEISALSSLDAISILKSEMDVKVIFKIQEVRNNVALFTEFLAGKSKDKDKENVRKINKTQQRKPKVAKGTAESFVGVKTLASKLGAKLDERKAKQEAKARASVKTETIIRHEVVFKQSDTQGTVDYTNFQDYSVPPGVSQNNIGGAPNSFQAGPSTNLGGVYSGGVGGASVGNYGRMQSGTGLGGNLASRTAASANATKVKLDWTQLRLVKFKKKQKVPMKEMVIFSHNMSILLTSGILLLDSLEIAKKSFKKKKHRDSIDKVILQVNSGMSLSDSLKEHKDMFDEFYVSIIAVGEVIGRLAICFEDLAVNFKMKLVVKKKVKTASIYPMLTMGVLVTMLLLGSKFFIPMFKDVFTASGAALPGITQFIFNTADFLPNIILGFLVIIGVNGLLYKAIPTYNKYVSIIKDYVLIRLPFVSRYVQVLSIYNFASAMQLTLKNGISLVDALDLGTQSVQNVFYRVEFGSLTECISNGASLSGSVAQLPKVDQFTSSMLRVGEESGNLGVAFQNISEYQQELLKEQTEVLVELMQPVMMLLLAAVLVPVIIGLYLPIIQMSSGGSSGL